jgi:hypothetical protein
MKRMEMPIGMGGALILLLPLLMAANGPGTGIGHDPEETEMKVLFLHHSTGQRIWDAGVSGWFEKYNLEHGTDYVIEERLFPKQSPYGWENYPYDFWNIWVDHGGDEPFMEEPTLEMLTRDYDLIVFKHCFPVSEILEDTGSADIASSEKRLENYKLQYDSLKKKMRLFPDTKFIVWTAAPQVEITSWKAKLSALLRGGSKQKAKAERARAFAEWVRDEWDEPGDNIFIWDFFELGTEGGIFLKKENAAAPGDSHPGAEYAKTVAPYLCKRIVDVLEGRGDETEVTGK